MKNYSNISQAYITSHGLRRCFIKNTVGDPVLHLLTDAKIKAYRAKGITVEVR